jgi:dipeptidase E
MNNKTIMAWSKEDLSMKKLFITSSFACVYKFFPDFIKEEYKGKRVTFIPTASIPEKEKDYVEDDKVRIVI